MRTIPTILLVMSVFAGGGHLCARAETQPEEPATDAKQLAEDAVADERPMVSYWVQLGYQYLQQGKSHQSLNAFERALIIEPSNKRALSGVGTSYIQLAEYRSALNVLLPLSDAYPADFSLKNNIAWLYATARDHSVRSGPKAVAMAQEALLVAPRDHHVWSTLSEAHYVSGDYTKALRASEETLRLAREQKSTSKDLTQYRAQVKKCQRAAEAMSLIE